jgi:hypothetical protein
VNLFHKKYNPMKTRSGAIRIEYIIKAGKPYRSFRRRNCNHSSRRNLLPFGEGRSWAVAGVEASEAAGAGLLELVLGFFEGGSMKPSSLQVSELDKMGAEYRQTLSKSNFGVGKEDLQIKNIIFIGKTAGRSL